MRKLFLILYYGLATHLPDSYTPVVGKLSNRLRVICCHHIVIALEMITRIG